MTIPSHDPALLSEVKPVRLQLSRRRGFNLQELSRATNGLEAVNVARPSKWGNPYPTSEIEADGAPGGAAAIAMRFYEEDIRDGSLRPDLAPLRGKNLACWCKPGAPCHADILLRLAANPEATP